MYTKESCPEQNFGVDPIVCNGCTYKTEAPGAKNFSFKDFFAFWDFGGDEQDPNYCCLAARIYTDSDGYGLKPSYPKFSIINGVKECSRYYPSFTQTLSEYGSFFRQIPQRLITVLSRRTS